MSDEDLKTWRRIFNYAAELGRNSVSTGMLTAVAVCILIRDGIDEELKPPRHAPQPLLLNQSEAD
jgi:hypothetical protein